MTNDYFNHVTNVIEEGIRALAAQVNTIATEQSLGFDKLPTLDQFKYSTSNYAVDTGAADAYVVTLPFSVAPFALTDGLLVRFKAVNANTGASTLNLNALGAKAIVRADTTALVADEIAAASPVELQYESGADHFVMMSQSPLGVAAAATSATAAAASAVAADSSASDAAADLVSTNADVVLTNADVVLTNADVVLTGIDLSDTNADVVSTNADVVLAEAAADAAASPELVTYSETIDAVSGVDLDLSVATHFTKTVTGTTAFTFSNPAVLRASSFTLKITNGGSQTVTFPASVDWPGGIAPLLTVSGVDILMFLTDDTGTIYYGFIGGLDFG